VNNVQIAASEGVVMDGASRRRCRQFIRRVLGLRELEGWEISVLFCDDSYMRQLNRKYRAVDQPTDVLSFGQREGIEEPLRWPGDSGGVPPVVPAGDVVISLDTLRRNAQQRGIAVSEELKRLLIHGILHLEGMNHGAGEGPMISLQEQLVQELEQGTLL
jgi:probable rRNA maturation factor